MRSSGGGQFRRGARVALRSLGAVLGPAVLSVVLFPGAAILAAARVSLGRSDLSEPGHHRSLRGYTRALSGETRAVLTGLAWVFRDRFAHPAWRRRIEIPGAARVHNALGTGRPVVLATVHTEAMYLLARFCAAAGFETAVLVEDASRHSRRFGTESPSARAPIMINAADVRAVSEFLRRPRILVIAADAWRGKHVALRSEAHGATISLATGAARLARRHEAACMSAVVLQRLPWRYSVALGTPVSPQATPEDATLQLARDILDAALPHRESWAGVMRDAVRPIAPPEPAAAGHTRQPRGAPA